MAQLPRVLESAIGEHSETLEERQGRLESVLRKAENYAEQYEKATQEGKYKEAKALRKYADQEATLASRLIGVLEIKFDVPMIAMVGRAKGIFRRIRPKKG